MQSALESTLKSAQYNVANGIAPLDANSKIPLVNIPDSVASGLQWQDTWNATTNTPTIPVAAAGNNGWFYKVSVAGSQDLNGSGAVSYAVGDWLISNGTTWEQIAATDSVMSVAGKTGVVSFATGASPVTVVGASSSSTIGMIFTVSTTGTIYNCFVGSGNYTMTNTGASFRFNCEIPIN